jgi:hypothetical protein
MEAKSLPCFVVLERFDYQALNKQGKISMPPDNDPGDGLDKDDKETHDNLIFHHLPGRRAGAAQSFSVFLWARAVLMCQLK